MEQVLQSTIYLLFESVIIHFSRILPRTLQIQGIIIIINYSNFHSVELIQSSPLFRNMKIFSCISNFMGGKVL